MQVSLKIFDETSSGEIYNETVLRLASKRVSAREVIEQRVRQEIQKFNESEKAELFSGLVQPRDAERELNGYKLRTKKAIDANAQVKLAIAAFSKNQFFFLVDDRQVESLDDEFAITENTKVTFLKLIPIVGG